MVCISSEVFFCDLMDLTFCASNFVVTLFCEDRCCTWEKRTFYKFLPRLLIGAALDTFAIFVMMFTSCVYFDGKEYFEGAQNYSFSFDPTKLINYCNLNDTELAQQNLKEVTYHREFLFASAAWLILAFLYVAVWMIYYCRVCCKFICNNQILFNLSDYYLRVAGYKIAFGSLKFLNFAATIILIVKCFVLVTYVDLTPLKGLFSWFPL